MTSTQLRAHFTGRVQGVGFRYTAHQLAKGYDVVGSVRNLPDGRVELVVEGERAELEAFLDAIRQGPLATGIQDVEADWQPATGTFRGFGIG